MVWLWIATVLAMLAAVAALLYASLVARDLDREYNARTHQLALVDARLTTAINNLDRLFASFRGARFDELDRQVKGLYRSVVYLYERLDVAGNDPATKIAHELARAAGVRPALPTGPTTPPTFTLADDDDGSTLTDPRD